MICGILLLIIFWTLFKQLQTFQLNPTYHQTYGKVENRPEYNTTVAIQTRSCRFVYVDLGSNIGVQIRKLYQPWLYPDAKLLTYFNKFFGKVTKGYHRQDVCSFGFEANPRHMKKLKHIEEACRYKGLNVHIFNSAVSDRSGDNVNIFSQSDSEIDWGAGIIDIGNRKKVQTTKYSVETVDIAKFLEENVLSLNPEKVLVKMDIEGSELIVLPHLLKKGLLCKSKITKMVIELHSWALKSLQSDLTMDKLKELLANQSCDPTLLIRVDDESYNTDVDVDPAW